VRLGKNQIALLLIIDEATVLHHGRAFTWEESIRYINATGAPDSFFMMASDLRSVSTLVERGLVECSTSGYTSIYTTTDRGRRVVSKLRETTRKP